VSTNLLHLNSKKAVAEVRERLVYFEIPTFENLEIAVNFRPTKSEDIPALKLVLDGTGLFQSEILAAMVGGFLDANENNDVWLTSELNNEAVGFCCAAPEKLTDGSWNMLAIAVLPSHSDC
jgi:hypothetical protein